MNPTGKGTHRLKNKVEKIKISSKRLAQLFEYPVKSNSDQKLARKDKGNHHILLIKGKFHQ